MFNSLYSRIAAGLAALFLVVGLIFIGITVFSTDMYQQEVNQKLNTDLARQIVNERILMTDGRVNPEALKDIFHMLMVINPGIEIYLLDPRGTILTYSAPQGSVKRTSVDLAPVKKWLAGNITAPVQGDDPKNPDRKKVFSAARIQRDGKLEGFLYVILGGAEYDSVVQKLKASYILQLSAWMIAAGLLFTLVAGLLLFALLTGRLKSLAKAVDAFKRGDSAGTRLFSAPGQTGRPDEIYRLTATFREMAGRIDAQMTALKASDQMRRDLVANVSHDLRTPLATLQGYIETLLIKEDRYTRDEKRQTLEMAIRHCRRLNTLVSDLFELAKLDSPEIRIQTEVFSLQELTQDVVQKFALTARENGIRLAADFDAAPGFVAADIALVERALENLIENALHYTPRGGDVTVGITVKKEVSVSVTDTGPGIPAEELELIFKRFYRGDAVRKDRQGHAGLGLAITRRIVALHGRDISVDSEPGRGTCFSFSLPPATLENAL